MQERAPIAEICTRAGFKASGLPTPVLCPVLERVALFFTRRKAFLLSHPRQPFNISLSSAVYIHISRGGDASRAIKPPTRLHPGVGESQAATIPPGHCRGRDDTPPSQPPARVLPRVRRTAGRSHPRRSLPLVRGLRVSESGFRAGLVVADGVWVLVPSSRGAVGGVSRLFVLVENGANLRAHEGASRVPAPAWHD